MPLVKQALPRGLLSLAQVSLLSLTCVALQAQTTAVPPGATPGGAKPIEGFRYPQPFTYPSAAPPPEVEQKIEQVEKDAPRMRVRGFQITGVDEDPESGINQQAIDELVKTTAEELVATVAAAGFTISMFETITSAIAGFYRERGYFLARAYIPEQTVNDGIVRIHVIEGFLDQVLYTGNNLYSNEQLDAVVKPLVGQSIHKPEVEEIIFTLNDYPGLSSSMVFGPGLKPGSAAIELKSSEVPSTTYLSFDNYGSNYTGENRLRLNHRQHNLLGQADLIDVNFLLTLSPANSKYISARYQQPVINSRFLAGGGLSYNLFDVGGNLSDLGINGESTNISGFMTYIHSRNREERMSLTLGLDLKSAVSKIQSTVDSEDKLSVVTLSGDYAGTSWSSSGVFQTANITLHLGLAEFLGSMDSNGNGQSARSGDSGALAGGDFTKLSYSYSRVYALGKGLQSLILSFRGQQSSDLLTSLEQFSLGGPGTVRAYPVAEALMDKVNLFSVEWMAYASPDIEQTWLNKLRLSLFFDWASGSLNDPLQNEIGSVSFSGLGGSINVEPFNAVKANVTLAFDTGDDPSDNMSLPFYFSLIYDF